MNNNEIIFRAKATDIDKWFFGSLMITDDDTNNPFRRSEPKKIYKILTYFPGDWNMGGWEAVDIKPETIGQYIGLKDKNKTKAFTGDVFRDEKGVVRTIFSVKGGFAFESNPTSFGLHGNPSNSVMEIYDSFGDMQNASWFESTCEIIGNIFDNGNNKF